MPVLLVDDRDGRVVAKLESEDEAMRVLEAMATEDADFPEYLCLVEGHSTHGSFLGTDTSVTIRIVH